MATWRKSADPGIDVWSDLVCRRGDWPGWPCALRKGTGTYGSGWHNYWNDHKEMPEIWCQGKERPEVTQYLLPQDVLWGCWVVSVCSEQSEDRVRSWCWASDAAGISGPEDKYTGWSAWSPSPPARHTDPKEQARDCRGTQPPMVREAPTFNFPGTVSKMWDAEVTRARRGRKPRGDVVQRRMTWRPRGPGSGETVRGQADWERGRLQGHYPCPAETQPWEQGPGSTETPRSTRRPVMLKARNVSRSSRDRSSEKCRWRNLEKHLHWRKTDKETAAEGKLGFRGGREETCQKRRLCGYRLVEDVRKNEKGPELDF